MRKALETILKILDRLSPTTTALSPNTEIEDTILALENILKAPGRKRFLSFQEELEIYLKDYFQAERVFLFNSGRSALYFLFSVLNFRENSQVLLQAFTCCAVPLTLLWNRLLPNYLDINEEDFNLSFEDLERKYNKNCKALILQHTFGIPANLKLAKEISSRKNLFLVEDLAHTLNSEFEDQRVGKISPVSILSFSRDKTISCVFGGALVVQDPFLASKIEKKYQKLSFPSFSWTFQQLSHPILMNFLILPTFSYFGKYLLKIFQTLRILSKANQNEEKKKGKKPTFVPRKLPPILSSLVLNQFRKIEKYSSHRKEIENFYRKELKDTNFKFPPDFPNRKVFYLRFPLISKERDLILKKSKKRNIYLGDWYDKVIAPKDCNLEILRYKKGSCPTAENLSKVTFNLPTHIRITQERAERIVNFLKTYDRD